MRQILLCMFPLFFLPASLCGAREREGIDHIGHIDHINHLVSLDLSYSLTGILNQGWGIGAAYEKKLFNYLSVRGSIGHMTFLTGIEDVYCTSVGIALSVNYYPFGSGLDKLYVVLGSGCDFMNYFGKGEVPANAEDVLISLTPGTGWKFIISKYFMMDISAGYKFIVVDAYNYREIKTYTNAGFQFRLGFKVFFRKK